MIPHLSYSQYTTYTKCPRSWYLGKIRQAEEKQTWYIPIGSAVHEWVELYLQGDPLRKSDREAIFYRLIREQMKIEPDLSLWLAGGPKDAPITEEKALQRAEDCYEKALGELEAIEVWEVEYDATGNLPGLEVPLKAFIDIIGEHKKKGPVILDWKTGSTKPDNFQLETYAALLKYDDREVAGRLHNQVRFQGRYVMISPTYTSATRYVDLSKVDPEEVGRKYQQVYDLMKQKLYPTKAGFDCKFCFHQDNCLVNAGPLSKRAQYYDRSAEDGFPF